MAVSMHGLSGGGFGSWRFIVPAFIILGIILGAVVWGASNSNGADRIQPDYSSTPLAYGSPSNGNAKPSYNPTFGVQNPPPGDAFGTPNAQTPSSPSALPLPNSGQPPTGSAPPAPFLGTPAPGPSDPNAVNQPSAWPNPLAGQPFGTPSAVPNGQPNSKYQQLEQELNRQSTVYQNHQNPAGGNGKTTAIQPGTRVAAVVPQAVPGAPGVPVYAVLSQGVPGITGFGPGSKAVGTVVVAQGNRVYINFKLLINNIGAQLPVAAVAVEARDGNVGVQGSQVGGRKWLQAVEKVASQALPLFGKNAPTTIINNGGGGQQTPAQQPGNTLIFQGGNIVVQFVADGALPPDPNTPNGQNPNTGMPSQPQGNPSQPSAPNGFQSPPAGQNGQPGAGWPQQPPQQSQPNQPYPSQYPNGQPAPQQYPPQNWQQ